MLQKFIIILLLTVLSLRPTYFVGNVVYYETHLNEIIEEYCINKDKPELQCNGKCHLAKEVSSIDHDSENPDAITKISTAFFPVYFQKVNQIKISAHSTEQITSYFNYESTYSYLLSNNIHKPPIV